MPKLAICGGKKLRKKEFPKWPQYDVREINALKEVIKSHNWGGYPSPNVKAQEFAKKFAVYHNAKYGICAANGTVTLAIALKAAGIKPSDEVITTPYTFVATASACIMVEAIPVFVDIDKDTYCIDVNKIEDKITDRTTCIIPVHLGQQIADMDRIMEIAKKHNLVVIEDCAHAHGARWKNKGVGSIGHLGSFSFQSSKLMTAGEGGIILTSNQEYEMRCQSLVNCGRKEKGYDTFEGRLLGWNYRMTELQAAILLVQLKRLKEQIKLREKNIKYLEKRLKEIEGIGLLKMDERITTRSPYQYIFKYYKEYFDDIERDKFLQALRAEGIPADGPFYTPLYDNHPLFPYNEDEQIKFVTKNRNYAEMKCPEAEKASYSEAVWLHHRLFLGSKKDIDDIADAIIKIKENINELK